MGKSIRSKVKRTFRSKKRETGVYAATEAARLHRLNAKLVSVASVDKGDVSAEDVGGEDISAEDVGGEDNDMLGWCWLAAFGVMDANDITVESMDILTNGRVDNSSLWRRSLVGIGRAEA